MNSRELMSIPFPGGNAAVPKPSREALLLSAKQWAISIREELQDMGVFTTEAADGYLHGVPSATILGRFDHLMRALKELGDAE